MADLGSLLGSAGIGGAIGKAIVSLELSTAKYQSELKAAEAQTVAGTNKMGAGFSKFSGLAASAFAAVGVAAVAGLALSVKAALEANEAHLKLTNTFQNNAMLADSSVAAFEAQADALRDLTGVDDEAIVSGQALLGMFDLTGSQVLQLTPLVVDLAAKTGIDLEAAFKASGKAATGSTGALARYIGAIETGATPAETFANVLDKLGRSAGTAEELAKAEPWRVLSEQFEEIAEEIGQELIPVLQDLAQTISDNMPAIERFVGSFSTLLDIFFNIEQISFAPWTILGDAVEGAGGKVEELNLKFPELEQNLEDMQAKAGMAAAGINNLSGGFDNSRASAVSAGISWGRLSKAGKEIADGLKQEIPEIIGTVQTYKDTFDLSPSELIKITSDWAKIARTIARDLRVIGNSDLKPAMREAISALPPEMRNAWVEGSAKQRGAIEASIKKTLSVQSTIPALAREALTGGRTVGRNIASGIALGITTSTELITTAAANAVRAAIAAANRAAGAASPSKEMAKLGKNLMEGLRDGIEKNDDKAIAAAEKAMQKIVDAVSKELDKLQSKASSFRDAIRGGFSGFLDLSGAFGLGATAGTDAEGNPVQSISEFVGSQVAGAQALAQVLKDLKAAGAGQALLQQVAQGGAAAIPFAQQLLASGGVGEVNMALKAISDIAGGVAGGLTDKFFGDKIDELKEELREIKQIMRESLAAANKQADKNQDVVIDGEKVGKTVERIMSKNLDRRGQLFDGALTK